MHLATGRVAQAHVVRVLLLAPHVQPAQRELQVVHDLVLDGRRDAARGAPGARLGGAPVARVAQLLLFLVERATHRARVPRAARAARRHDDVHVLEAHLDRLRADAQHVELDRQLPDAPVLEREGDVRGHGLGAQLEVLERDARGKQALAKAKAKAAAWQQRAREHERSCWRIIIMAGRTPPDTGHAPCGIAHRP